MPSLLGWLHERQGPRQAFAQQTPSTQKLDEHCTLSVQGAPMARLHAPEASQLNASMPPRRQRRPPSPRAATSGRAPSSPASPPASRCPDSRPGRVCDRRAVVDRDRGHRRRRRRRAASASSRSANVPRDRRRNRERPVGDARRGDEAARVHAQRALRRARLDQHRAEVGRALGRPARPSRARACRSTARRCRRRRRCGARRASSRPTRRTGRASPRPTRAASSCRNRPPRRATARPERARSRRERG